MLIVEIVDENCWFLKLGDRWTGWLLNLLLCWFVGLQLIEYIPIVLTKTAVAIT